MVAAGVVAVLTLSAVMFIASFLAGTVPLAMSLSQERMKIVSSLGVGLLVGTSLGVVLPEGIEMLYSVDSAVSRRPTDHTAAAIPEGPHRPGVEERQESQAGDHSYHLPIALALVSGYLVMHLLTFLPPLLLSGNPESPIPLSALPSSPTIERVPSGSSAITPTGTSNTTIGLCIHALADGIALGSSAVSESLALEGIVFFAIMLHKVPTPLCTLNIRHPPHFP
jgi:zinc transporter 9